MKKLILVAIATMGGIMILAAIVLMSAAVVGLRVWWLKRKMARGGGTSGSAETVRARIDVIEGEYHEVRTDRDET